MASLTVKYTRQPDAERQAHALRVEVTSATGVTPKVFVFRAGAGGKADEFMCVASPLDIEEYPEDAADPEAGAPYYRVASVDLLFRSTVDLDETKALIADQLTTLVQALSAGDMTEEETVTYG